MHTRRHGTWRQATTLLVCLALLVTGCGSGGVSWHKAGDHGDGANRDPAPNITITEPANGAANVPTSVEIAYSAEGATASDVELRQLDAAGPSDGTTVDGTTSGGSARAVPSRDGTALPGAPRADGSSWVPAKQLKYATRYTATVSATVNGKAQRESITFTTMAKPSNTLRVSSVIGDNQVVGSGMPIIITLSGDVSKDQRAAAQRRLFVTSDPPQEGGWNWFNAHEIHYRPKVYWQAKTKVSFRAALGGVALGGGRYGANDITVTASTGPQLIMTIENRTKQMTVTQDGTVLRTIPVSLGKPTSPSASGNLLIMEKKTEDWFDSSTYGVPADSKDGYRTLVKFTQRLTWDGEYIHAAKWSESDQGKRNVSHGCTNISEANATWLFGITHVGDPVIIKGTEERVRWGNGYTDWDISFEEYLKGGAQAPTTSTSGAPSPAQS